MEALLAGRRFRLMFQDEARFGRITDPRKAWCQSGIRPGVGAQVVREYTYAYAAVSPLDGELDTLILPDMYTDTLSVFLAEVSRRHPQEQITMVLDGAPCHRSGMLVVPENIRLVEQPPYSPELNPTEHLWEELREKWFWNQTFPTMRAVEDTLVSALQTLEASRAQVQRMTAFSWIMHACA